MRVLGCPLYLYSSLKTLRELCGLLIAWVIRKKNSK